MRILVTDDDLQNKRTPERQVFVRFAQPNSNGARNGRPRMYYSTQGEKHMFAIRLALFLGFFYGFTVIAYEGTGIDPHGGGPRLTRATSDQGGGLDPDGRTRTTSNCTCATPDAGVRIDPEG
jgi:hypothetical protein